MSYREVFRILGDSKIIDKKLARELEKLASFRNVLVHLYWRIDYGRCYEIFARKRKILEKFLGAVARLIRK